MGLKKYRKAGMLVHDLVCREYNSDHYGGKYISAHAEL